MKSTTNIVTTPMCSEIAKIAGIKDFIVNKNPDLVKADIAIVLSETKVNMKSIKIKLNTYSQINESIQLISKQFGTVPLDFDIKNSFRNDNNKKIKVKVYSKFLKEIVEDMGFNVVENDYDYIVYPDYMEDKINKKEDNIKMVQIPSHKSAPLNPIKRAQMRYNILEKELCMKP